MLAIEKRKAHPVLAQRSCLALLGLQKTYGSKRLERACTMALQQQAAFTGFIKNLLKNGLAQTQPDTESNGPALHHTNLRGAAHYQ